MTGESYKVYTDKGYSGKNIDRPAFQDLLRDIEAGKVNRVIVYRLDRISRSVLDFANLIEVFQKNRVDFVSTMEKFDTSKEALIMSRAADYIPPRRMPSAVMTWIEEGYDHDPRIEITNIIKETSYDDIEKFYQDKVQNRPIVIMIAGNKKNVDIKALEKYGKVKFLKFKDIYK